MTEIIILSIVQGTTEFLPISSSSHLILISKYFEFNNSNLTLDISLHFGSLIAIILYFREDLKKKIYNIDLLKKIIISSLPLIIVGYFLVKLNYLDNLRSYKIIGWSTIIFGIILFLSDLTKSKKLIEKNFYYKKVLIIGFFQILSLIPGVSRSGIVITAARLLKFKRTEAAKISFLTSIPVLIIISAYNLKTIMSQNNPDVTSVNITAIVLSFIFSYITIRFFINFLKKYNLLLFAIYRIILGLIILLYVYN